MILIGVALVCPPQVGFRNLGVRARRKLDEIERLGLKGEKGDGCSPLAL
jgi:hypothetical protein